MTDNAIEVTHATVEATVHERGAGLPDVGDYVAGDDGEVYRVVELVGRIHTGGAGVGNYRNARLTLADWRDVEDDSEPVCRAVVVATDD